LFSICGRKCFASKFLTLWPTATNTTPFQFSSIQNQSKLIQNDHWPRWKIS
jgi:hypothetical protein